MEPNKFVPVIILIFFYYTLNCNFQFPTRLDNLHSGYGYGWLENFKGAKGIKFCHLNVRSLLKKIDQFRFHFEDSGIDVITLSETWLSSGIGSNILQMDGYQLYRWDRDCAERGRVKKGGRLMIYVHKSLKFTPVETRSRNVSIP